MDYINGFDDFMKSCQSLVDSVGQFFGNVQTTFAYIPSDFWVIVIGAIAAIVVLRIVGR